MSEDLVQGLLLLAVRDRCLPRGRVQVEPAAQPPLAAPGPDVPGLWSRAALAGKRLLFPLAGLIRLRGLEEGLDLPPQLRCVLVPVDFHHVIDGDGQDLLLVTDDRQRAVHVARKPSAVRHHARHRFPPFGRWVSGFVPVLRMLPAEVKRVGD